MKLVYERQQYLEKRRHRLFKENKLVAPLSDVQLSRADIEWLLATHEKGRGPLDWNDLEQRQRKGLHLWGADLRKVDLSNLPLANADLGGAHLEGAMLSDAHLEGANFTYAHLEGADLRGAYLEHALFFDAHLERAALIRVHLEGALLMSAHVEGANLWGSFFDAETDLNGVTLYDKEIGAVSLVDVRWRDINLAVVDWSALPIAGDESVALRALKGSEPLKTKLEFLERAPRAYGQLAVALRNQGLNEDAARFAYRAQLMQRKVFWHTRKFGRYLFSLFLGLTTGYGYRVWRSFATYVFVILGFATIYFLLGLRVGLPISYGDAIVFSMTSFHGRGFSPGENIGLSNPLTVFAAIEAFVGLLIEVTFIATLTQRLFAK
jgi:uncharacterized protein YjbI with pentapeptide repeats